MKKDIKLITKVKVANPVYVSKSEEVELIIDTGATFSVIKKDRLQRLEIPTIRKRKLKLANGQIVERDAAVAWFIIDGKGEGGSDVIFGEENDPELLSLLTLEGMALSVDTTTGELKPIELLLI